MTDKVLMWLILKCIGLMVSVISMLGSEERISEVLILTLALSCVLILQYILSYRKRYRYIYNGINVCISLFCFLTYSELLLPLLAVLMAEQIETIGTKTQFYFSFFCSQLLLLLLISPHFYILLITCLIDVFLLLFHYLITKLDAYYNTMQEQKETLLAMEEKLKDNKRFIKTLRYTAALEERNRLAARLHDKIGHGISGSIIMLEASMMMLEKDRDRAKQGIENSISNLRKGVDDIRLALREERPVKGRLGLSELKVRLEQFQMNYGIHTTLTVNGDMQRISAEVWQCIHENLEESLTNLLKHSNAVNFNMKISVMNKVIWVEYRDNGTNGMDTEEVIKGLGLETMEERTIKCGGKFFMESSNMGFEVKNLFLYD